MTGFTVNAHRYDPYKNFNFRVLLDGRVVLGVSKVSALKRTTEVVKHQSGGVNTFEYKSPGRTKYEAVTMERGITHDVEFERWANSVYTYANDSATDLANYKKDLTLEVLNLKGQVAIRYFLHGCWVSEFTAVPELDANNNGVAIESIKVEVEGWERDTSLSEPNEAG
ncbi:MAG: phage tail protein [Myxococcales bacterium]|nr:phage tail protein [Myxococcales bacterium]MCB9706306.1 phage tail protein [Myxococcales bacterium]